MSSEIQDALKLPPMDQVGFVYRDMAKAIAMYEPLFGPFKTMSPGPFDYEYRGKLETAEVKLAFGRSGDIEIELIEWVSGGTPHKEFIDAGNEGMQHLRFIVDDLEEIIEQAKPLGYEPIWKANFAPGLAVAYMERDSDPLLIEFFENKGLNAFQSES
ncbi:MAG: VOC family protein [Pseudomonadales bacterium]